MTNPNKAKPEKVDIGSTKEDRPTNPILPAIYAVSSLIVKLCEDATTRNMRDEYKTFEAIANLMNSIKP